MDPLAVRYELGGVHLPELGLWLDPHLPKRGEERAFISHAHADHLGDHREVILSEPTARLMEARMGGERLLHIMEFGVARSFDGCALTLLPAGHIFGSAMAWVQARGTTLLYTGDFKLRPGLSSELCEPRPAEVLIMETTYGRPEYTFPPTAEVLEGVVRFCRDALDNDETAVLLGYSLGKSQELLRGLAGAGLPIMLHSSVQKLTRIYEQFGQKFPPYLAFDVSQAQGKVLVVPPAGAGPWLRRLGKVRKAILTGWAVDPGCRFRSQADAAFPLSDHADFPDLLRMVELVKPKRVLTLHGFAADFAEVLRERGYDARALSEPEQLGLGLRVPPALPARGTGRTREMAAREQRAAAAGRHGPAFQTFAQTCQAVAGQSSKLEKVRLAAEYLRGLSGEDLNRATLWFTGAPFAGSEGRVLQLGWAVMRDALCETAGVGPAEFRNVYLKHSDLGETAKDILRGQESEGVRLEEVRAFFEEAERARGPSQKLPLLVRILGQCCPAEAKFLVKIMTGDLRIGLKEGLVEEAVARAFGVDVEEVREANLLLGNIGKTAELASRGALSEATLEPFQPIKFMLASPEASAEGLWERMKPAGEAIWLEDKFDGIRCQLHRLGSRVELYSRDLKRIGVAFPEIVTAATRFPGDFILDGELLAVRGDKVLPFAELQRRIARREPDLFFGSEVPVVLIAFDLLWKNGHSLLKSPLRERRSALEALLEASGQIRRAPIALARSPEDVQRAFQAARDRGNEGLMAKDPGSVYSPGRRGLAWIKLKQALGTLDCVVVAAEYGHGKRRDVLSDYTFAVRDQQTGRLLTIGKAYTGLTDAEIAELTDHFLSRAVAQSGRVLTVQPDVVLEIAFDRIQRSQRHESGLALRFPRIVQWRKDKRPEEIDTVQNAEQLVVPA